MIKFIRDVVILNATKEKGVYAEEEIEKMNSLMKLSNPNELLSFIPVLSELQNDMKWSLDKDIMFETGILKLAMKQQSINNDEKKNDIKVGTTNISTENKTKNLENIKENVNMQNTDTKPLGDEDLKTKVLTNLKENRKMIMHTILSTAQFQKVDEDLIHIIFNKNIDDVNKQYMQKEESKMLIKEVVKNTEGKEMKIKYVF